MLLIDFSYAQLALVPCVIYGSWVHLPLLRAFAARPGVCTLMLVSLLLQPSR